MTSNLTAFNTPSTHSEFERIVTSIQACLTDVFALSEVDRDPTKFYEFAARSLGFSGGYEQIKTYIDTSAPGSLMTYVLRYKAIRNFDGQILDDLSSSFEAEDYAHAVEQLMDSFKDTGLSILQVVSEFSGEYSSSSLYDTGDDAFRLHPGSGSNCWIRVGNGDVEIKQTDEGIFVDVFPSFE